MRARGPRGAVKRVKRDGVHRIARSVHSGRLGLPSTSGSSPRRGRGATRTRGGRPARIPPELRHATRRNPSRPPRHAGQAAQRAGQRERAEVESLGYRRRSEGRAGSRDRWSGVLGLGRGFREKRKVVRRETGCASSWAPRRPSPTVSPAITKTTPGRTTSSRPACTGRTSPTETVSSETAARAAPARSSRAIPSTRPRMPSTARRWRR